MSDLHERWPHRWITPKAKSYKSPIDRLGIIATQSISKGETVGVLGGVIVPKEQIRQYWKEISYVGIQISDDFFIVPTSREELDITGTFNHSCDPNCGFKNSLEIITIRDIVRGEELLFDYAFCESIMESEFACKCGAKNCRKKIKPTDWQLPHLQKKYGNYFSPYLREKFSK